MPSSFLVMDMRKIGYKAVVSLCFLGVLGLTGCGNDSVADKTPQGIVQEKETEISNTEINNAEMNNAEEDIVYVGSGYTTKESLCTLQDVVNKDGITYQILSWEKTKEFGNRNSETLVDYLGDRVDADNNFVGDECYVFITIKITNETEETVEVCRCPGSVALIDETMQVFSMGPDCIYIDEYWYGGDEKSVLYYRLEPGESITCEFGQMVWDSEVNVEGRSMYYWIKFFENANEPANRYILLEE